MASLLPIASTDYHETWIVLKVREHACDFGPPLSTDAKKSGVNRTGLGSETSFLLQTQFQAPPLSEFVPISFYDVPTR